MDNYPIVPYKEKFCTEVASPIPYSAQKVRKWQLFAIFLKISYAQRSNGLLYTIATADNGLHLSHSPITRKILQRSGFAHTLICSPNQKMAIFYSFLKISYAQRSNGLLYTIATDDYGEHFYHSPITRKVLIEVASSIP